MNPARAVNPGNPAPRFGRSACLLLLSLGASACNFRSFLDPEPGLRPGIRVEVDGALDDPTAPREVEEKEPGEDLLEVRGPLGVEEDSLPRLLGAPLVFNKRTDFENSEREEIEEPVLKDGQWVKVKGTGQEDGSILVDKLRLESSQNKWEIEGIVSQVEDLGRGPASFGIDPFGFRIGDDTNVELRVIREEWREFLTQGPLGRRAVKEQRFTPFTIPLGDRARLGGQLAFEYEREDNYDLNNDRDRDQDDLAARFKLATVRKVGSEGGFFLAEVITQLEYDLKEGRENERDLRIQPGEVYLFLANVGLPGLHLQLGRQDLDERREWLYDQGVDAARFYYDLSESFQLEASASLTPHLLTTVNRETIANYVALLTWRGSERWRVSGYVVDRRSRDLDEFSPFHFGLRSYVKPDPGWSHWLELSHSSGLIDYERLNGNAIDAGVTWVADHPLEPSLTVGYALGSGDDDPTGTNGNFRQTGLHDNNDKWNGVTSFRYYGEVIDPELSNLQVLTAGLGVRPTRRSSVDLIFHSYRQQEALANSLISELRAQPDGSHQYLGRELDMVIGYRNRLSSFELVGGAFWPGSAFPNDDLALKVSVTVRLKF